MGIFFLHKPLISFIFSFLETKHKIHRILEVAFKNFFVIKEIEKEVANKKKIISNSQAIQDELKRGKNETPNQSNSKHKKIKVVEGKGVVM